MAAAEKLVALQRGSPTEGRLAVCRIGAGDAAGGLQLVDQLLRRPEVAASGRAVVQSQMYRLLCHVAAGDRAKAAGCLARVAEVIERQPSLDNQSPAWAVARAGIEQAAAPALRADRDWLLRCHDALSRDTADDIRKALGGLPALE